MVREHDMKGTHKKHNATFKSKVPTVALVVIRGDRPRRSVALPALPPLREPARKVGNARLRPHTHGATTKKGFGIDKVKGRRVTPAVALTAIGADIEPAGLHLNKRLRLSHDRVHLR